MNKKFKISLFIIIALFALSNCGTKGNQKKESNGITNQDYLEKGLNIATNTQMILGKNLQKAIGNVGPIGALEFCNVNAISLTDSMSLELNAQVKRVSDKNRNAKNAANKLELEYITQAKIDLNKNGVANPKIQEISDKMVAYYPIITNGMCLQCHGNPNSDIEEKTYTVIKEKYPNDKAIGYSANELRGIWVIAMDK